MAIRDARATFTAVVRGDTSQAVTQFHKLGDTVHKSTAGATTSLGKFQQATKSALANIKANAGLYAAAAGAAFMSIADDVLRAGVALEATAAKVGTVFGDQTGRIESWAEDSAKALGLTKSAAQGAAAGIADLLKPMGFTTSQATDQTLALMDLAGALSAWSGGTRTAADVAQILTKAMLGEREMLKELGISITEAEVTAELAARGQAKMTGAALAQAKALATQSLIVAKSADAQRAWADGSMDGVKAANEATASFAEMQEMLVTALYPALKELVPVVADVVGALQPLLAVVGEIGEVITFSADGFKGLFGQDAESISGPMRDYADAAKAAAGRTAALVAPFSHLETATYNALSTVDRLRHQFDEGWRTRRTFDEILKVDPAAAKATLEMFDLWVTGAERGNEAMTDAANKYGLTRDALTEMEAAYASSAGAMAEGTTTTDTATGAIADYRAEIQGLYSDLTTGVNKQLDFNSAWQGYLASLQTYTTTADDVATLQDESAIALDRVARDAIGAANAYTILQGHTLDSVEGIEDQITALSNMAAWLAADSPLRVFLLDYIEDLKNIPTEKVTYLQLRTTTVPVKGSDGSVTNVPYYIANPKNVIGPGRASGGAADGRIWAGEFGPELIDVPGGSWVHNSSTSAQMVRRAASSGAGSGGATVVNIPVTIHATPGTDRARLGREMIDAINAAYASGTARLAA